MNDEFEDSCENCWWYFGLNGQSCQHEAHENMDEDKFEKPCGWFEPKVKRRDEIETDADRYEAFQEMWN